MNKVFRLEGFINPSAEKTSAIREEEPKRLKRAFVDTSAIDALGRLVEGPLRTKVDLQSAELAARAIVFHDEVNLLSPCIDRNIYNSIEFGPLRASQAVSDNTSIPDWFNSELKDCKLHQYIVPVDELLEVPAEIESEVIDKFISKSDSEYMWNKDKWTGISKLRDDSRAYCVKLLDNINDYYEKIFLNDEYKIRKVVRSIPDTGSPAYFGLNEYQRIYEGSTEFNPTKYFDIIDTDWSQERDALLSYGAKIPIGFLTAILASRVDRREQLPNALAEMRAEFSSARNQLWDVYDDVNLRSVSFAEQIRLLKKIEQTAKAVVPEAMKSGEFWLPIRFGFMKRLFLLDWVGATSSVADSVREAIGHPSASFHMVDIASPLSNELGQVKNLNFVMSRIISDAELSVISSQ